MMDLLALRVYWAKHRSLGRPTPDVDWEDLDVLIAALDALEDPRPRLPWRCTGCGAKADEVQWAAIDSIYYDGHTVGISEPDLCGPFRMPGDETEPLREENRQLQVRLDAATVLIREVDTLLRVLDARMCGTGLSHFCDFSEPRMHVRAWLAGDKEAHGEL